HYVPNVVQDRRLSCRTEQEDFINVAFSRWSPETRARCGFFTDAPLYSPARRGRCRRNAPGLKTRATKPCRRGTPRCAVHACSSRHGAAHLFRMRVLRVFFVAAQFPVDRNYRRCKMKCKACQELCRTDSCTVTLCLLSTTDCSIVTLCPTSVLASPFECAHPN